MISLFRRAARLVTHPVAFWQRPMDPHLDHGHVPYGAWEAELTAYARLRAGAPLKVQFAVAFSTGWTDDIHLTRPHPPPGADLGQAFRDAELELEHALVQYRHGWREAALLWHTWTHPDEQLHLPWPPWDEVALPGHVIRLALGRGVPELLLPSETVSVSERRRHAARWLTAAWEDGAFRARELAARPGLAERLPAPPVGPKLGPWPAVLVALARHEPPAAHLPDPVGQTLTSMLETHADRPADLILNVLALVETLGAMRLLPPVPEQRPAWLKPSWGRWHRATALRAALDAIARSPENAAMATITSAARAARRSLPGANGRGFGGGGGGARPARDGVPGASETAGAGGAAVTAEMPPEPEWGPKPETHLSSPATFEGGSPGEALAEGGGNNSVPGAGSGPGSLGELHIVSPSGADRAAYWQLRGALAPEIERLISRLQASGDAYYASAPRRFKTRGRLDRTRLVQALKGRNTVFRQHIHVPEPEHALCLLIDCSASMHPYAELLREMVILVESAATAVGARVTAFSFGTSWDRMEPAAKGAPLLGLGREIVARGGTPFGPALGSAAAWLAQQPYEEKRLWVFTDGRWSARDRAESGWRPEHLRNAIVWVLSDPPPAPPHAAMRLVGAPTLPALIEQAPRYFWRAGTENGSLTAGAANNFGSLSH